MKVRDLSLILNRRCDNNIEALLLPSVDDEAVDIIVHFHSLSAYKQFKKNPNITIDLFDEFDAAVFKEKHIENIVNTNDFINRALNSRIICRPTKSTNYNEMLFKQQIPITIDIRRLPINEKMAIITNPLAIDNVFFLDDYTEKEELSSKEIQEMYQYILNIAKKIRDRGYSQLESIYYIYNELKNKIYKEENSNESAEKSRSLNQILNGNCIVCSGYTNYFMALSDILELHVEKLSWPPLDVHKYGHASIIAYINDPKYEVQGVWGIDTTWDSKKNEEDQNYKNNLSHFLIPLYYDEKEKERYELSKPSGNIYYSIFESLNSYHQLLAYQAPDVILKNARKMLLRKVNKLYAALDIRQVNESEFDLEEEIKKIKSYACKAFPLFKLEELVRIVTPKNKDNLEKSIQSSPSYRSMNEDGKSIYRLVKLLHL